MLLLWSAITFFFIKINFFKNPFNSIRLSNTVTVRIQIRTDILSVLIWVLTVCSPPFVLLTLAGKELLWIICDVFSSNQQGQQEIILKARK